LIRPEFNNLWHDFRTFLIQIPGGSAGTGGKFENMDFGKADSAA